MTVVEQRACLAVRYHGAMRRGVLVGLLACACGRVGFDETGDGTSGSGACASVTFVQSKCVGTTGQATQVTLSGVVTAGHLLVLAINADGAGFTPALTDTFGTQFLPVDPLTSNAALSEQLWYGVAAGTGSDTIQLDLGAMSGAFGLYAHELDGPVALDQFSVTIGTSAEPTAPAIETSATGELLFAHAVHEGIVNGVESGFTELESCTGDMTAYRVAPTPGTYAAEFEASSNSMWLAALASFRCR
jgi:hypothetical protein